MEILASKNVNKTDTKYYEIVNNSKSCNYLVFNINRLIYFDLNISIVKLLDSKERTSSYSPLSLLIIWYLDQ
ncbi:MAG: hypothetical protein ACJAS1_003936 [Oleiphilaceae bacterium]|jgi:hypothetical protein